MTPRHQTVAERVSALRAEGRRIAREIRELTTRPDTRPVWGPCAACGHVWRAGKHGRGAKAGLPPARCVKCFSRAWNRVAPLAGGESKVVADRGNSSESHSVAGSSPAPSTTRPVPTPVRRPDFDALAREAGLEPPPRAAATVTPPPRAVPWRPVRDPIWEPSELAADDYYAATREAT